MALDVEPCCRLGLIVRYVEELTLERVALEGITGEPLETAEVEKTEIITEA